MAVTFNALQKLRASDLQAIIDDTVKASKPSATVRNTVGALAVDPHLVIPLQANYTYILTGMMYWTSGATPDIQFALGFPAGATTPFGGVRMVASSAGITGDGDWGAYSSAASTTSNITAGGTGAPQMTVLGATIIVGSTAGNLSIYWAQNVSTGTDTTLLAGSSITALRQR